MRNTLIGLLIAAAPATLAGQSVETNRTYQGDYYVLFTTGSCQHAYPFYGVAGGAEALVWKGLTIGADASYQQFRNSFSFGLATLQAGYHFRGKNRAARWDPFASYGIGVGMASRLAGSGSLGGGLTYWVRDRVGARFEARVQGVGGELLGTIRVGVSFR